ncbi:DUF488 domain-containing protein [Botrimarina hoheduenensis]|uniref:DUF488 domain-containing protein n=1 Tax=Botrimarina hoheduenensis TaxID=2528000 RepID=A0A5C5VWZ7_9BACT|nr:DUF488 domain-containing protein [Botrimarina hoheduenensis]TWT42535.1 hypothetical protein Pla111_28400 [Botrimarina hoheduenensis]
MSSPSIYTVGYSIHEWPAFVSLLRGARITAIADVRSHPAARLPQYRQENLSPGLRGEGIAYVWLGKELGARRDEPEAYLDHRADYERIARLPLFLAGIERLQRGARTHTIALMCAEREPLDCHRGVLIARVLQQRGWGVKHLLADGTVEEHRQTEARLIDRVGIDPLLDASAGRAELLKRAYDEYGAVMAYRRDDLREAPNPEP